MKGYSTELLIQELLRRDQEFTFNDPTYRIEQLLSTAGDGTGTTEMAAGAQDYIVQPPAGWIYRLERINIYIEDGTNEKFSADQYGGSAALTNGIICTIDDANGHTLKLLTPQAVKKIGQWDLVAGVDMVFTDFATGGSDFCAIRWSFFKGGGAITLNGDKQERFKFSVRDNLGAGGAALVSHLAQVQGHRFRTQTL